MKSKDIMNDYDVSIFVLTENNEMVYCEDYVYSKNNKGIFVVLTNDILNPEYGEDNTICIYRDSVKMRIQSVWQTKEEYINGIVYINIKDFPNGPLKDTSEVPFKHLNGYKQTQDFILNVGNKISSQVPGIYEIYKTTIPFNNIVYNAYLPAVGQMAYIDKNVHQINDTMQKIYVKKKDLFKTYNHVNCLEDEWWTSTGCVEDHAWCIGSGRTYLETNKQIAYMLPLFKIH